MSDGNRNINDLSPDERRAMLKRMLEQKAAAPKAWPLSFAQQRLWFLDQLRPGTPLYNMPILLRLNGDLNVEALRRSLDEIVRRHETLRTVFGMENGEARQYVSAVASVAFEQVDLTAIDAGEREADLKRRIHDEAFRPFDLEQGPLFRAVLWKSAGDEHVLLLNMHHIISDGWSLGVLNRELAACYEAFAAGREPAIPEPGIRYADFAQWQRERLQGELMERRLDYWREQLQGLSPLRLPTDRPRPTTSSYRGGVVQHPLPPTLTASLERLAKEQDATLFMTTLAAFNLLLYRYTGRTDTAVGSPIANRNRSEIEPLIGFFVNTLVLRTDMSGDPTFRELLMRVRETTLGAYAHQDVPFEKLVEELSPERELSGTPFFQAVFALQNAPVRELSLPGLTLSRVELEEATTRFDLELHLWDMGKGLSIVMFYDADLFDAETMERMAAHYERLLHEVVRHPDKRISQLSLLSPEERRRLMIEWNDTAAPVQERPMHALFEEAAERRPEATALTFGNQTMSYRELNVAANRLAARLLSLGVERGDLVGICIDRSFEMVIALLGILKSGAAFLPLDPKQPQARLQMMLNDASIRVLLTQESLKEQIPAAIARGAAAEEPPIIFALDSAREQLEKESGENPERNLDRDDLAYVVYTSGSTGVPKGIAMPHGALANLFLWQAAVSTMGEGDRTIQYASLNFDVSYQELFVTWMTGGTVVLVPEETRRDVEALVRFMARERVNRIFLPFVVLQQIAEVARRIPEGSRLVLREVVSGGEPLQITRQIAELFERSDRGVLRNHYGPSECHVVTEHVLAGDPAGWPTFSPVGRPIANTRLYILDRDMQPMPVGIPGEVYLGCAGIARGYLNRPGLTAASFIPDPFGTEQGGRLYRTGDLARFLADGTVDFLGRIDHQVKVRGYRIELGEIEAALGRHPAVRECAVAVYDPGAGAGEKRLVGYIVPAGTAPSVPELRSFLLESLPDYMTPNDFVTLEALPLNANRKVDRRALPAPGRDRSAVGNDYVPPTTSIEKQLAEIWADVLGIDRVGIHDNFFDLGGHSVMATRLASRIRDEFGIGLPLRNIFEHPTVADLATVVEQEQRGGEIDGLEAILSQIEDGGS